MADETPKRGRPKLPIDANEVLKLARLGCSNLEIADWFGCSPATVTSRFQAELSEGRAAMKISLRRAQLRRALAGGDAMLVHLGKFTLGQRESIAGPHGFSGADAFEELGLPRVTVEFVPAHARPAETDDAEPNDDPTRN